MRTENCLEKTVTKLSLKDLLEVTRDREKWRTKIMTITKRRRRLDGTRQDVFIRCISFDSWLGYSRILHFVMPTVNKLIIILLSSNGPWSAAW